MECIERHAPLKRTKITRPLAPWLHDEEIKNLQSQRDVLRYEAHSLKTSDVWEAFRDVRSFINTVLSSSKPKAIWRVIHRILNPCSQPLQVDVNELNNFFADTAHRTVGSFDIYAKEDLLGFVDNLQSGSTTAKQFSLHPVTYQEVLSEIKAIRQDTSTGPDQISAKYLKPIDCKSTD